MLDCVMAVKSKIEEKFAATDTSPLPILYINMHAGLDTRAPLPHGWMYPGVEGPGRFWWQLEETPSLHLYARSLGEMQELEDAVEFLDDHQAPTFGDAIAPHYELASKQRLPEGENLWHTTITYTVTYSDNRKQAQAN